MDITIITGISIGVFTIIGVLTGIFFVFFKMLRDDIKDIRVEIKELRSEVHSLGERVSRMEGQLTQVTQMLYYEDHSQEDLKEN